MSGSGRVADRLAPLVLPDLTGRRAVVTGASSGIGLATATALAGAGAEVVLAVRDQARGEAAASRITGVHPQAQVRVELVELGSLVSIADFTARLAHEPVHLLVNNAGTGSGDPDARTADGFDLQVGVNYLGAWAVTGGLWPALRAAGSARVVTLGSLMATRGRIGPEFGRPGGSTYHSYSDSKLAMVVIAGELRRALRTRGCRRHRGRRPPGLVPDRGLRQRRAASCGRDRGTSHRCDPVGDGRRPARPARRDRPAPGRLLRPDPARRRLRPARPGETAGRCPCPGRRRAALGSFDRTDRGGVRALRYGPWRSPSPSWAKP